MIELHRLNGVPFYLNHRLVEIIEKHPDTVITINNDRKYLVKETPEEIQSLIIEFEKKIFLAIRNDNR